MAKRKRVLGDRIDSGYMTCVPAKAALTYFTRTAFFWGGR